MQHETAKVLLQTIARSLELAIDAENKLLALEKTLQDRDPSLFQEYEKNLETMRKYPRNEILPAGLANLLEKLAQDR